MRVVIVGRDLPGRWFCRPDGSPLDNVHVGVQVRRDPVDFVAADVDQARFELEVGVTPADGGGFDFRGPGVHGRRGDRFLYLTWGNVGPDGEFEMFRRAKLMLTRVSPDLVRRVLDEGGALLASVVLRDRHGGPRCARIDPPDLDWSRLEP